MEKRARGRSGTGNGFPTGILPAALAVSLFIAKCIENEPSNTLDGKVTMLGHPTSRILLARDAHGVDLDGVIDAAAASGTMIEFNANPHRLDLDAVHRRRTKARGGTIVVNPDAHSPGGLPISISAYPWHGAQRSARGTFSTPRRSR